MTRLHHSIAVRCTSRVRVVMLVLAALLLRASVAPGVALAGCGIQDFGACADDIQYTFWYGWTAFFWTAIDAPLLQAAYLIDVFRNWLVSIAFTSAYQVLTTLIDPLIVPFAIVALIIGYILFALMPLFGHTRLMNVRHVLTWTLMAPLLLTASGTLIAQVEQIRVELGNAIFTQVSAIAPGAIFGVSAADMAAPQALYSGGDPCGSGALTRPGGSVAGVLHMDDLAAALLWANAQDIHCPKAAGEGQDIPDAFYLDPPDGPKYASRDKVGDMNFAADRAAAIADMQRGFNRVALGVLPCVLAVAEALIQLLFALALIALWVGLPFALVFVFFEESSSSVALLFRQGLSVLKTSWFASFLLAIVFAALKSSAEQGNATAYTAVSLLALLLTLFLLVVGLKTLTGSVEALNQSMLMSVGVRATEPLEAAGKVASGAAGLAAGAVTGGVTMAAVAAAGYHQTGSTRYAAGAALGRIQTVANVGEVAAAMGWVEDEDLVGGLYAGQRSRHSAHSMRLQMQSDARRRGRGAPRPAPSAASPPPASTSPMPPPSAARVVQGDVVEEVEEAIVVEETQSRAQDAQGRRDRQFEAVGDRWQQLRAPRAERVALLPPGTPPRPGSERPGYASITRAPGAEYEDVDMRYHAYSIDETGTVVIEPPRSGADLPAGALTVPNVQVTVTKLLGHGYTVQQNADQTVTFWHSTAEQAATAQANPEQERKQLVKTGAITEEGLAQAGAARGYQAPASDDAADASGQASPAPASVDPAMGPGSRVPSASTAIPDDQAPSVPAVGAPAPNSPALAPRGRPAAAVSDDQAPTLPAANASVLVAPTVGDRAQAAPAASGQPPSASGPNAPAPPPQAATDQGGTNNDAE